MEKEYKENMYEAFKAICIMKIDVSKKIGMLTHLFSIEPKHWRVVGVSVEALKVFHKYNFKRKSKMGINRSHKKNRSDLYIEIMRKEANKEFMNYNEWWNFYYENDETNLTTSSENLKKVGCSEIIKIENRDSNLFKSKGFAWTHGTKEVKLLKELYEKYC